MIKAKRIVLLIAYGAHGARAAGRNPSSVLRVEVDQFVGTLQDIVGPFERLVEECQKGLGIRTYTKVEAEAEEVKDSETQQQLLATDLVPSGDPECRLMNIYSAERPVHSIELVFEGDGLVSALMDEYMEMLGIACQLVQEGRVLTYDIIKLR